MIGRWIILNGSKVNIMMPKTSIIVTAYNQTAVSAHITMACLANITKYTDPEDYELILVEDIPKFQTRDDYHVLKIDKHIVFDEYTRYTVKMNRAAEQATGKYICFIQNDVFVWEGWLEAFHYYFDHGLSRCMIPDQFPRDRQYIKAANAMSYEEGLNQGHKEDCMYFLTREAFDKMGGWNEDIMALVQQDFYQRCENAGVRVDSTNKIQVTHITLATHYQDMAEFDRKLAHDTTR